MPEEVKPSTPEMEPEIFTIPEEFYGGVIKTPPRAVSSRAHAPELSSVRGSTPRETPPVPPSPTSTPAVTAAPAIQKTSSPKVGLVSKLQQPPFLIRVIIGISVVVVGIFTIYYLNQARVAKQKLAEQALPAPPPPAVAEAPVAPAPPPPETPLPPEPAEAPTAVFPAKNYVMSADSDGDKLTDVEETIYRTDPQKPDADSDGYIDSLETENLYNPTGFKPERLLPTGLVKLYQNPVFNYSIFYPAAFVTQTLDFSGQEVIFSSETGEFIEVLVVDNAERLPILDWYLKAAPGVVSTDLKSFTAKQKAEGLISPDGLTAYFPLEDKIFVVTYNIGLRAEVNFLTTLKMMLNSLRLNEPPGATAPPSPAEALREGRAAPTSTEPVSPTTAPEVSILEEATTTP